ncbi:hypothetical protein [Tichowtungia aerotolerans]|uniref:Uncharacterized protein n=1 Tax=Tichowtungia aerotolerans TaxID=2697043 RepID=A0A6P1M609_9BACT|nr:hypothetical protein [Tichowtungia aerotolerans]QHI69271.1 hypothetical protein GT409_07350 [Tichowtungia aerotolerans]
MKAILRDVAIVALVVVAAGGFSLYETAEVKILFDEYNEPQRDELFMVHKTYWGLKTATYKMRLSTGGEWQYQNEDSSWSGFIYSHFHQLIGFDLDKYPRP